MQRAWLQFLSAEGVIPRATVICSSAGNHAQAVSYHATRLKIDSVIVMPEPTPYVSCRGPLPCTVTIKVGSYQVKVKATKSFGGRVVQYGAGTYALTSRHTPDADVYAFSGFAEAYEKALEIAETENRTFVHAFNDRDVVAGKPPSFQGRMAHPFLIHLQGRVPWPSSC